MSPVFGVRATLSRFRRMERLFAAFRWSSCITFLKSMVSVRVAFG
jgi:hypothetical protein